MRVCLYGKIYGSNFLSADFNIYRQYNRLSFYTDTKVLLLLFNDISLFFHYLLWKYISTEATFTPVRFFFLLYITGFMMNHVFRSKCYGEVAYILAKLTFSFSIAKYSRRNILMNRPPVSRLR